MMDQLFNGGAMPVLERLLNYTEQRQHVLVNDIANLSTPNFKPADLDPQAFQESLRDAIDQRRSSGDPATGPLEMADDSSGSGDGAGGDGSGGADDNQGILFHDQNNRDLERIMQHLAENTLAHSTGIELMRDEVGVIKSAISEHV